MTPHNVADDTAILHDLIDKALAGDEVVITRDGKPIAELRPAPPEEKPAQPMRDAMEALREFREARPPAKITSVELLRQMYDDL